MVFSSNIFLFGFMPVVLAGYYLLKKEYRNTFLLLASLFFYFWGEPRNIWIMIASIIINYTMGLLVGYLQNGLKKKLALILAVMLNIGILF